MSGDALLAFKTAFMYILGLYLVIFFKILLWEPRPFWVSETIHTTKSYAVLSYSTPNSHVFNLAFLWMHYIYNKYYLYSEHANECLRVLSFAIPLFFIFITFPVLMFMGTNYLYQNVIGGLFTFLYLWFSFGFDKEIM